MTTKDAILKLADAVSGNTSANVVTDVQALAVLAQAMTGGVPAEPLATVDDAIGYIADNYSGGGGGVTLGDVCLVITDDATVKPGDEIDGGSAIMKISVGDAVVTDMMAGPIWQNNISTAATGATVEAMYAHYDELLGTAHMRARSCTVDPDTYKYLTISDTIEIEHEEFLISDIYEPVWAARFVMPEIPEGSALLLTPEYA